MTSIPQGPDDPSGLPEGRPLTDAEVVELLGRVERLDRLNFSLLSLAGSLNETLLPILKMLAVRPGKVGFGLVEVPDEVGVVASRLGYGPTGEGMLMVNQSLPTDARIAAALAAVVQLLHEDVDDEAAGLGVDPADRDKRRTVFALPARTATAEGDLRFTRFDGHLLLA